MPLPAHPSSEHEQNSSKLLTSSTSWPPPPVRRPYAKCAFDAFLTHTHLPYSLLFATVDYFYYYSLWIKHHALSDYWIKVDLPISTKQRLPQAYPGPLYATAPWAEHLNHNDPPASTVLLRTKKLYWWPIFETFSYNMHQ